MSSEKAHKPKTEPDPNDGVLPPKKRKPKLVGRPQNVLGDYSAYKQEECKMGIFDIVAGIGKAAVKSMGDAVTKQQLEAWNKMRNASSDRLRDFYNQNNTSERNNASKRALALAAMGGWEAQDLLKNDEPALRALKRLRESVSLDSSHSAETLRDSIDRILR